MRAIIIVSVIFVSLAFTYDKPISKDCKCKGIPLYGKVKIVDINPNFRVRIVESFPDIKVKVVNYFPNKCGEWQIVESFPDFTIQFVSVHPDFTVKFVESFPGIN